MQPEIGGVYEANIHCTGMPVYHLVEVLGGPNVVVRPAFSLALWTVYDVEDDCTRVCTQGNIFEEHARPKGPKIPVEGDCPSCDEPEMLFYNDDYLCCQCRDILIGDV